MSLSAPMKRLLSGLTAVGIAVALPGRLPVADPVVRAPGPDVSSTCLTRPAEVVVRAETYRPGWSREAPGPALLPSERAAATDPRSASCVTRGTDLVRDGAVTLPV